MDRYLQFGLRDDADEQIRRAVRDGFRRAGLSSAQLTEAMDWYRDHVRPGMDEEKLTESFAEFAAAKRWGTEQRDAAVSVYGQVRDQGPAAVMSPAPSTEEDAATLARAHELLRSDPNAYWRDAELQEAQYEALERQKAAPTAAPAIDHDEIERRVSQQHVDRFATMLREEPEKYWRSPELQQQHRNAIAGTIRDARPVSSLGQRRRQTPDRRRRQARWTAARFESERDAHAEGLYSDFAGIPANNDLLSIF